jgi:hypothetical protein
MRAKTGILVCCVKLPWHATMEFRLSRTKTCRHPGLTLCEDEGYEACKTRSEKHPNLPPHCGNGNSVPLPLILGESRANRK